MTPSMSAQGRAMVNLADGTRQPFTDGESFITVMDWNNKVIDRNFHDTSSTYFTDLPLYDNLGDNYTFVASASQYKDAGLTPVHLAAGVSQRIDLMLLPKSNAFNFANATWKKLASLRPKLHDLLAQGAADDAAAATRYGNLSEQSGGAILACLLNITTAADQIHLPEGTPLDYFKAIIWDSTGDSAMAQDRFYGWSDPAIIPQLESAKAQGTFVSSPYVLHPGATRSYKQIQFGEANLQLTFHEQDRMMIGGMNCTKVEPDIDYYRDPLAHFLLEVAVNAFGSLTDPRTVYALRWIAGQRAGIPQFDPLYTIEKA